MQSHLHAAFLLKMRFRLCIGYAGKCLLTLSHSGLNCAPLLNNYKPRSVIGENIDAKLFRKSEKSNL